MIKNKKTRKNSKRRTKNRQRRSRKVMRGGMKTAVKAKPLSSTSSSVQKKPLEQQQQKGKLGGQPTVPHDKALSLLAAVTQPRVLSPREKAIAQQRGRQMAQEFIFSMH